MKSSYSEKTKIAVVSKYRKGVPVDELSKGYGVPPTTIYNWLKKIHGRSSDGRFKKGNTGGHGNPYLLKTTKYRKAVYDSINEEEVKAIWNKMVRKALSGDVAAAELVMGYCVTKATKSD